MGIYDTGQFPWVGDIGTSSIADIQALARSSGVQFSTNSAYRPGDPGYHGSQNAVDMGATAAGMVSLAAYLMQYSAYLLELIHSGGGGFFVKNGQRVDAAYYGESTVSGHYDHVHCATTHSALLAAAKGDLILPASTSTPSKRPGCLPTATAAIITLATIGEAVTWMIH